MAKNVDKIPRPGVEFDMSAKTKEKLDETVLAVTQPAQQPPEQHPVCSDCRYFRESMIKSSRPGICMFHPPRPGTGTLPSRGMTMPDEFCGFFDLA